MIDQEKAIEYMMVAGLVCLDIDILHEIVENGKEDITAESLKKHIRRLWKAKQEAVSDPEKRKKRYHAANWLFTLPREGL